MKDFRKIKVWEKSHILTLNIYKVTRKFPREELYGLISQMRRCSASIPQNIAEGCGRGSDAELARFLQIAMGSASELDYHLLLAKELDFITENEFSVFAKDIKEVMQMLASFIKKIHSDANR
jgi:four helix bundle protein